MNSELEEYAAPIARQMLRVKKIIERVSLNVLDRNLNIRLGKDLPGTDDGRLYVQVRYFLPPGTFWEGRKWFITDEMGENEILKTCYAAFESAVRYEVMKGFKIDNVAPFSPETDLNNLINLQKQ